MAKLPIQVGVIGCGNISRVYFETARRLEAIEIVACADLVPERALAAAELYDIPEACTPDQVLDHRNIAIVLNLTTPHVHAKLSLAALRAGKSVYLEKPLATTRDDAAQVLSTASEKGLRVGCAPDTFLGGGLQTARKLIDDGAIGEPVAATACFACPGHESWHPAPEFYYRSGGGPMLDMGPYYLTALVNLLGPIQHVGGMTSVPRRTRTITAPERNGETFAVETPTHITGTLRFCSGVLATVITSFDVWKHNLPMLEVHGTAGSLSLPDPNGFGGPVRVARAGERDWTEVPLSFGYDTENRGLGLADMAHAIVSDRPHRASGELAQHVLDAMLGFLEASDSGRQVQLKTTCNRPAPLPTDLPAGVLD